PHQERAHSRSLESSSEARDALGGGHIAQTSLTSRERHKAQAGQIESGDLLRRQDPVLSAGRSVVASVGPGEIEPGPKKRPLVATRPLQEEPVGGYMDRSRRWSHTLEGLFAGPLAREHGRVLLGRRASPSRGDLFTLALGLREPLQAPVPELR